MSNKTTCHCGKTFPEVGVILSNKIGEWVCEEHFEDKPGVAIGVIELTEDGLYAASIFEPE